MYQYNLFLYIISDRFIYNICTELEGEHTYDNFGSSVASWNGYLAIGSPYDDTCTDQSCDASNRFLDG